MCSRSSRDRRKCLWTASWPVERWAKPSRAIPGDDQQTWARRLVEVGESLNLRVRSVECNLSDALTFVRQGIPLGDLPGIEEREHAVVHSGRSPGKAGAVGFDGFEPGRSLGEPQLLARDDGRLIRRRLLSGGYSANRLCLASRLRAVPREKTTEKR